MKRSSIVLLVAGIMCANTYATVDDCSDNQRTCSHKKLDSGTKSCDVQVTTCAGIGQAACGGAKQWEIAQWQDTELGDNHHQVTCQNPGGEPPNIQKDVWQEWNTIEQVNTKCSTPTGCKWNNTPPVGCVADPEAVGIPTYKLKKVQQTCPL